MSNIFRTRRPIRSSNLVHRRSTKTRISDKRRDLLVKVKVARSRDASDKCWPINQERNVLEEQKLVGRLSSHLTGVNAHQFQGHYSRLMLRLEVRNIFRTGRPTNFKLGTQTEYEDPHGISNKRRDLQGQRSRSQGHVIRVTAVGQ